MQKSNWWVHVLLTIASFIAVFPVLWILSTSFKPESEVFSNTIEWIPQSFTLDNYKAVLTKSNGIFLTWFKNSALIALFTTVVGLVLSTTAAYAISRFRFFGKKWIELGLLITQMFPGALLIIPLYLIVNKLGLLNTYAGVILAYSTTAVPFCVMMLKNYFDTIPYELEEAARVDGLSHFGTFYRIVLPLALPGLAVTAFYSFITAWNEFLVAITLLNQEQMYTLPIGLQQFVNQFNTDFHYMSAAAMLITLPVLVFFIVAQKYLISGLTSGGVK
ncbi:sugar ABC transporter permease [Thermoflavimicrobium dichotomicum]|uniref:Arabinogalactan oligomer / maltooligosaccharide transport system permease protein n=1 Tax=Thermoflavimicrobium dichotomicum TaxID=46223 RepID=A0A1I3P1K3_9BACL|nr:carbohydrate ABC transporter permease [Thermoflavimicrobium dichotomicum]SFJ14916.1 arabinogalactan oligomer / maltooligosaccharide transport system permease protein [Thermoflavimicrobium dichotomicum]